ncbi:unnamed protein product [Amoebophrya sp. A25]|nr:unnamed protein product [Amoebophrya sp. A25]|eukprot:GSA25T00012206001.1
MPRSRRQRGKKSSPTLVSPDGEREKRDADAETESLLPGLVADQRRSPFALDENREESCTSACAKISFGVAVVSGVILVRLILLGQSDGRDSFFELFYSNDTADIGWGILESVKLLAAYAGNVTASWIVPWCTNDAGCGFQVASIYFFIGTIEQPGRNFTTYSGDYAPSLVGENSANDVSPKRRRLRGVSFLRDAVSEDATTSVATVENLRPDEERHRPTKRLHGGRKSVFFAGRRERGQHRKRQDAKGTFVELGRMSSSEMKKPKRGKSKRKRERQLVEQRKQNIHSLETENERLRTEIAQMKELEELRLEANAKEREEIADIEKREKLQEEEQAGDALNRWQITQQGREHQVSELKKELNELEAATSKDDRNKEFNMEMEKMQAEVAKEERLKQSLEKTLAEEGEKEAQLMKDIATLERRSSPKKRLQHSAPAKKIRYSGQVLGDEEKDVDAIVRGWIHDSKDTNPENPRPYIDFDPWRLNADQLGTVLAWNRRVFPFISRLVAPLPVQEKERKERMAENRSEEDNRSEKDWALLTAILRKNPADENALASDAFVGESLKNAAILLESKFLEKDKVSISKCFAVKAKELFRLLLTSETDSKATLAQIAGVELAGASEFVSKEFKDRADKTDPEVPEQAKALFDYWKGKAVPFIFSARKFNSRVFANALSAKKRFSPNLTNRSKVAADFFFLYASTRLVEGIVIGHKNGEKIDCKE